MTREEKILKEAKEYYSDNIKCYDAFLHGVEFADEHRSLEDLWHDASEEPKKGEYILVEVVNTLTPKDEIGHFVEYADKWVVNTMKTEGFKCRWAYIKDLLPKTK